MQSKTQWRMNIDETEEISKTIEYLSELVTPSKVGLITSLETLRSQCFNNFVRRTSNIFWNKKNVQHINKVNSSIMSSNSCENKNYIYTDIPCGYLSTPREVQPPSQAPELQALFSNLLTHVTKSKHA